MRFSNQSQDYRDEELNLHSYLVKRPHATQFVFAESDAMQGAGINEGALLVVDHSLKPRNGDIVVAAVQGEFLLRAIRKEQNRIVLYATADGFLDVVMTDMDEVWGVVVAAVNVFRGRGDS